MTKEQWALEPHKVQPIDTSDARDRAWMQANSPEPGVRYMDDAGSVIYCGDEFYGPWRLAR